MEKRGCKLLLFQKIRDILDTETFEQTDKEKWTIGQVSARLIGNHETLEENNRFKVIPSSSMLTFDDHCSLIDVLQRHHNTGQSVHPRLHVTYQDVVGDTANIFLSFPYNSRYLDLVDAMEQFFERSPEQLPDSTYFWFDLFVNDQWNVRDKDFGWWSTTFRMAIQDIGVTAVFLSPWDTPDYFSRAW